ncbi:MAG: DUF1573 domain-containing protein [Planctomycetaceae bacterium]|nr:DUF1573 domain-containing protein [Planctomycetaceae bacterium]
MDANERELTGLRWWLCCLGGLVPAVLAAVGTESAPAARPVVAAEQASLSFAQYAVNHREIPAVARFDVHFDFANVGSSPVEIVELKPSCGCLTPRLFDEQVSFRPGEQGRFYVSVGTATEDPGPHDYSVTVKYNDGAPREEVVRFQLEIPQQKVLVEPTQLLVYQLDEQPQTRQVIVTDARGGDLSITGAELSSSLQGVNVTVEPRVKSPEGFWQTPIRIDVAEDVPPSRQLASLRLRTNDPEYEQILVSVMIDGRKPTIQPVKAEQRRSTAPPLP